MAKKMVEVAKECGADVVKFQKRNMEMLYRRECLDAPSEAGLSLGVYVPLLKKVELSCQDHADLQAHCRRVGIDYLCSPWDLGSVQVLEAMGVGAYKVPSACLSDLYLARAIQKTGKPVIFSTGMHEANEVERLVRAYAVDFRGRVAFMHCTSSYPTAERDVNLRYMERLRGLVGGAPVGYSGHERGVPVTVAAVAMGAQIVERHFTLDRTMEGPDHAASLEPHGLETLVRHIRAVDEAMGDGKAMNRGEIMARETIGKCLTWARDHKAGDCVTFESFCATSPGYGLPVTDAWRFAGDKVYIASCDIKGGAPVEEANLTADFNVVEGAR